MNGEEARSFSPRPHAEQDGLLARARAWGYPARVLAEYRELIPNHEGYLAARWPRLWAALGAFAASDLEALAALEDPAARGEALEAFLAEAARLSRELPVLLRRREAEEEVALVVRVSPIARPIFDRRYARPGHGESSSEPAWSEALAAHPELAGDGAARAYFERLRRWRNQLALGALAAEAATLIAEDQHLLAYRRLRAFVERAWSAAGGNLYLCASAPFRLFCELGRELGADTPELLERWWARHREVRGGVGEEHLRDALRGAQAHELPATCPWPTGSVPDAFKAAPRPYLLGEVLGALPPELRAPLEAEGILEELIRLQEEAPRLEAAPDPLPAQVAVAETTLGLLEVVADARRLPSLGEVGRHVVLDAPCLALLRCLRPGFGAVFGLDPRALAAACARLRRLGLPQLSSYLLETMSLDGFALGSGLARARAAEGAAAAACVRSGAALALGLQAGALGRALSAKLPGTLARLEEVASVDTLLADGAAQVRASAGDAERLALLREPRDLIGLKDALIRRHGGGDSRIYRAWAPFAELFQDAAARLELIEASELRPGAEVGRLLHRAGAHAGLVARLEACGVTPVQREVTAGVELAFEDPSTGRWTLIEPAS